MTKLVKPATAKQRQGFRWCPVATVRKYDDDGKLVDTITVEGNELTTAGLGIVTTLLTGGGGNDLGSTTVRLGVGDDTTAFNPADTDLTTGSNQWFETMVATYPQVSGATMTFQSEYDSTEANFAWECWGLDVGNATVTPGSTANTLFNRKVTSFGIKSGGTWTLTVVVTADDGV